MQPGALAAREVSDYKSRVLVDGVERPHKDWSVDRALPASDLPDQVAAWSGVEAATGSVTFLPDESVSRGGVSPWNSDRWMPVRGSRVVIQVGDGQRWWTVFTGRLDVPSGEVDSSEIPVKVIDDFDSLSARVSHDALLREMPPLQRGQNYRRSGLVSTFYVDLAARAAGFYMTPVQEPNTVVMVPCQGGMWPHSGTLRAAGPLTGFDQGVRVPVNNPAPWGFAVSNFNTVYYPRYKEPSTTPLQVSLLVAPDHTGVGKVECVFGTAAKFTVNVASTRQVFVEVTLGGVTREVCRLGYAQTNGAVSFTAVMKGGAVTLRSNTGHEVSGSGFSGTALLSEVVITGDENARLAGFMVNHPTETYMEHRPSREYAPNAVIDTENVSFLGVLAAQKAITAQSAESLLSDIGDSVLYAAWIDELGVLQFASSYGIRWRNSVRTITTRDDVLSLPWEDALLGSRSKVTVTYEDALVSRSRFEMVSVWRGSTEQLGSDEVRETIIEPGDDEAWVGVADRRAIGAYNWSIYNEKRGSYMGYSFTKSDAYYSPNGLDYATELQKIGPAAWKVSHRMGPLPAGVEAETRTADGDEANAGALRSWNRNDALPLVQAGAKAVWREMEYTPTGVSGTGPEVVHEGGKWLMEATAQRIAQYLQSQTAVPKPAAKSVAVVPDPRLQLGDKIILESDDYMGVRLSAAICGVHLGYSLGDGLSQELDLAVTDLEITGQTYGQFNMGASQTYGQFNNGNQSYSAFNAATSD